MLQQMAVPVALQLLLILAVTLELAEPAAQVAATGTPLRMAATLATLATAAAALEVTAAAALEAVTIITPISMETAEHRALVTDQVF